MRAHSTGSAGLINTIQMFTSGHIVAAIFGTIATVGWTVQGLGNAFYYRQVGILQSISTGFCYSMNER